MTNYRKFAVTGVSAAALTLAACTPPNENPSDQKVETGNTFEAPSSSAPAGAETAEPGTTATDGTTGTGTSGNGQSVQATETVIGGTESELDDDEDAELAKASEDSARGSAGATKTTGPRTPTGKTIGFINCLGTPEKKPDHIVLDCAHPRRTLNEAQVGLVGFRFSESQRTRFRQ